MMTPGDLARIVTSPLVLWRALVVVGLPLLAVEVSKFLIFLFGIPYVMAAIRQAAGR